MRILIGTHYFESHRGGIEIVAGQLARRFRARGAAVSWLACDASAPPPAECGTSVALPASNLVERRLGLPFPIPGLRALARIWREVRLADAVQLHDSLYPTNVAILLAAQLLRRPVVIVQHIGAVPYRSRLLRGLMAAGNACVARPMLAAADQVVFISRTGADHFSDVRFRRPPRLIPNGVDSAIFRPRASEATPASLRERFGLPKDDPVVLFVGRFVEKKGLPVLERLARSMPGATFAFAGWGPLDPKAWGLPNVRVMCGLAGTELAALYQAADCFVLPSVGEGLPLVIQEALASGLPVLCGADTATADEGLVGSVTGLPVDPGDPDATAAAFRTSIEAQLTGIPPASRRAADCTLRYDWTLAAAAHLALIEDLLPQPARALRVAVDSRG